ncbi:MAG: hypothetical protein WBD22_05520 [Pyrinomonadaceae bacterium]
MKRCPNCNAEYSDNSLEFCLEDGSRLAMLAAKPSEPVTSSSPVGQRPMTVATEVIFGIGNQAQRAPAKAEETVTIVADKTTLVSPDKSTSTANRLLELSPIVIALAHNWWQWLYIEGTYISSIASFIVSAPFLMWLLLLAAGVSICLIAVKRAERKEFAYTSLVILAINLILFLVPRR